MPPRPPNARRARDSHAGGHGAHPRQRPTSRARTAWRIAALVFCLALLGILTRPSAYLAVLWPANAVLLAMMVRNPGWTGPLAWLAASAGFVTADLITDNALGKTLWLTAANLAGVITGAYVFAVLDRLARLRDRHRSTSYVFLAGLAASLASVAVAAPAGPVLFQIDVRSTALMWLCSEFVNYLLILPVVLSAPRRWSLPRWRLAWRLRTTPLRRMAPLAGLGLGIAASMAIGHSGALAIPIPALLWCALTYSVFSTALLSMAVCYWQLYAAANGIFFEQAFPFTPDRFAEVFSLRIGAAMMMLGPLAVAISNAARKKALHALEHAMRHDALTKALSRASFLAQAERLMRARHDERADMAVLMADIDHFKSINDAHGHAVGDEVLVRYAAAVQGALRSGDLFGRLGGEEFAIVLRNVGAQDALAIANRLRHVTSALRFEHAGKAFGITVSIGLLHVDGASTPADLEHALLLADQALYQAKTAGRDRTVFVRAAQAAG